MSRKMSQNVAQKKVVEPDPNEISHSEEKSPRARGGWLEPIGQYVLTSFEMLDDT